MNKEDHKISACDGLPVSDEKILVLYLAFLPIADEGMSKQDIFDFICRNVVLDGQFLNLAALPEDAIEFQTNLRRLIVTARSLA